MLILKKTFYYVRKNCIQILPFAFVGGALLTVMFDYADFGEFLRKFFTGEIGDATFAEIFGSVSVMNFSHWAYTLVSFAILILLAILLSMQFAFIEKHMRIGKRTLNGIWRKINDNFTSTLGILVMYTALYEIWAVLTSAILFGFIQIFSGIAPAQYIFVVIVFAVMVFALLYAVHMFYLWLPCLQITGFRFYESLKYAYQLLSGIKKELIGTYAVFTGGTVLVVAGFTTLCSLAIKNGALAYVVVFFVYTILFTMFTVGQEVAYFEQDQMERADLHPPYQYKPIEKGGNR